MQRLSALYSKPRRLVAGLEGSRLPLQTPRASSLFWVWGCPVLSLRYSAYITATLHIRPISVFQVWTNNYFVRRKKKALSNNLWKEAVACLKLRVKTRNDWSRVRCAAAIVMHVQSHCLSPVHAWLPEVHWSGRASWKLLQVTVCQCVNLYPRNPCKQNIYRDETSITSLHLGLSKIPLQVRLRTTLPSLSMTWVNSTSLTDVYIQEDNILQSLVKRQHWCSPVKSG